jgi:hypothetical protein
MDALSELRVAPLLPAELELQSCTPELRGSLSGLLLWNVCYPEHRECSLATDTFHLRRRTFGAA